MPEKIVIVAPASGQIISFDGDNWVNHPDINIETINVNEGMIDDPTLTPSGLFIAVGEALCMIRSTEQWNSPLHSELIPSGQLEFADNTMQWIIVNWNEGDPEYQVTTDPTIINNSDIIPVARVWTHEDEIEYTYLFGKTGRSIAARNYDRVMTLRGQNGTEIESGLAITETGTRVVNIAEGVIWTGITRTELDAVVQASGTVASQLWYHDSGEWTSTEITDYNNTQYDDGTDLQNLLPNRYAVNWVFRSISGYELDIVLGRGNYTLAQAEASMVPPLPVPLRYFYVLVGRIIVKNGEDTATSIENVSTNIFQSAAVINHSDLAGLTTGDDHTQYAKLAGAAFTGDISLADTKKVYLDGGDDTYIHESSANNIRAFAGGELVLEMSSTVANIYKSIGFSDNLKVNSAIKLYMDGGGDTYIVESAGNVLDLYAGGAKQLSLTATAATIAGDLTLATTKKANLNAGGTTYLIESSAGVLDLYAGSTKQLSLSTTAATINGNAIVGGDVTITNKSRVRAKATVNPGQTLVNGTGTLFVYNTEDWDNRSEYNAATGVFTPNQAGYYYVRATLLSGDYSWPVGTVGVMSVYKNGDAICNGRRWVSSMTTSQYVPFEVSTTVYLNGSTDYISIYFYHNIGGNIASISGAVYNYLDIYRFA